MKPDKKQVPRFTSSLLALMDDDACDCRILGGGGMAQYARQFCPFLLNTHDTAESKRPDSELHTVDP